MTKNNTHCTAPTSPPVPGFALVALTVVGALIGCTESIEPLPDGSARVDGAVQQDAAPADSGGDVSLRGDSATDATWEEDADSPDANPFVDAGVIDANTADVPEDVPEDVAYVSYEMDVRPLLESSACADCHAGVGIVMDYAWISAPGETWCAGDLGYDRRWNCFEEHARTQMAGPGDACETDFYHRHGEPCFTEDARSRVLEWAADGYRE